jgi:thiol-disulfide isomerase/thioredoxin
MPAPEFEAVDLAGAPVSLGSLLSRGLPTGLFFTDPGCGACELVLDTVAAAQEARAGELTLVVLSAGSIDRIKQKATDFGLARVVPIEGEELLDAYGIQGFPAFVEIGPDGAVAMPAAFGADPVRRAILRDRPGAVAPAPPGVVPG